MGRREVHRIASDLRVIELEEDATLLDNVLGNKATLSRVVIVWLGNSRYHPRYFVPLSFFDPGSFTLEVEFSTRALGDYPYTVEGARCGHLPESYPETIGKSLEMAISIRITLPIDPRRWLSVSRFTFYCPQAWWTDCRQPCGMLRALSRTNNPKRLKLHRGSPRLRSIEVNNRLFVPFGVPKQLPSSSFNLE
ncbi:hypothetical protein Hypma_008220 [Hypsizygus marmoreus]|uniref:Uncharacterized protein n=1 Tax=Hypsizygus marmoreus TaxID=39966 RepID=A0A369JQV1_HYPMA|nr:hypothetical protein Hypma_008220 [Hypsizygus marmoreus]